MRVILQRVSQASVRVEGQLLSSIGPGLLCLAGVEIGDDSSDVEWLAGKISSMRIFADEEGRMNRSLLDTGGGILVVSQFTLHASTRKGKRPSFLASAPPAESEPLYESLCAALEQNCGHPVGRGRFGADMQVALTNDGPVTLILDSRRRE
jgi:D-tyrosyl-tRNA(Tyr) deacylase